MFPDDESFRALMREILSEMKDRARAAFGRVADALRPDTPGEDGSAFACFRVLQESLLFFADRNISEAEVSSAFFKELLKKDWPRAAGSDALDGRTAHLLRLLRGNADNEKDFRLILQRLKRDDADKTAFILARLGDLLQADRLSTAELMDRLFDAPARPQAARSPARNQALPIPPVDSGALRRFPAFPGTSVDMVFFLKRK